MSGTLLACRLAGVGVFATGGIGGVHRAFGKDQTRCVSSVGKVSKKLLLVSKIRHTNSIVYYVIVIKTEGRGVGYAIYAYP